MSGRKTKQLKKALLIKLSKTNIRKCKPIWFRNAKKAYTEHRMDINLNIRS